MFFSVGNETSQFEYSCVAENWAGTVDGTTDGTVITPPNANLETPLMRSCVGCRNLVTSGASDIAHCIGKPLL